MDARIGNDVADAFYSRGEGSACIRIGDGRRPRALLGGFLATAGLEHLTFARKGFQAQVPDWVPLDKDAVVLVSGGLEIALASALVFLPGEQRKLGTFSALFFAAVFPGNIAQSTGHRDALGLDSDLKRSLRLLGQPLLITAAFVVDALTPVSVGRSPSY